MYNENLEFRVVSRLELRAKRYNLLFVKSYKATHIQTKTKQAVNRHIWFPKFLDLARFDNFHSLWLELVNILLDSELNVNFDRHAEDEDWSWGVKVWRAEELTVLPKGIGPTEGNQLQRGRGVGGWCDGKSLSLFIAKLTPLRLSKLTSADFIQLYRSAIARDLLRRKWKLSTERRGIIWMRIFIFTAEIFNGNEMSCLFRETSYL